MAKYLHELIEEPSPLLRQRQLRDALLVHLAYHHQDAGVAHLVVADPPPESVSIPWLERRHNAKPRHDHQHPAILGRSKES